MGWEIQPPKGGKYEKPPVGNHPAVLVGLFNMGHQWQEPFKATDKGYYAPRAFFVWELVGEVVAGTDKNHVIGIDLTLSVGEKAKLRQWVEARTGKPLPTRIDPKTGKTVPHLDPLTELGQVCLLNVVANKKGYPIVDGMAAFPKGFPIPKPTYPVTALTLEEFQAGTPVPEWVPWLYGNPLEDHIKACREIGGDKPQPRKAAPAEANSETKSADPVPF